RKRPAAPRRRHPGLRAGVPQEAVAGDGASLDGTYGRRQERRRRRGTVAVAALRADRRRVERVRGELAAIRTGNAVSPIELRLDLVERGDRGRGARPAFLYFHAREGLRAGGHGRDAARLRDRADRKS